MRSLFGGWKLFHELRYCKLRTVCFNRFFNPIHLSQIASMSLCTSQSSTQAETVSNDAPQKDSEVKSQLSKRALKRIARAKKHKEYVKKKKESTDAVNDDTSFTEEDLKQSSYYFENGLRKVYPYKFVFATYAKGRWVGRTIYDVLSKEFGFNLPGDLEKAFESGSISVNNNLATADYVLKTNDLISHQTHRHENPVTSAPLEIIANTDDMLVINKPSSIPCHPCGRYRFNSVIFILGKEMGFTNLRNIYRLDRLTSGVLVLCKTVQRTKALMDQVAKRQVQKEYVCRVVGHFPDGTIKVDQPLQPLSNKLRLQVISPKGKSSQTTFTRLSYNGKSSVVKCVPHTGRTHQIRVHLQYLGHPIINDVFYNNDAWGPSKGKNGVYEIPFDKVCERILKEHHVTQWDGGDNPYYEEKLKESQSQESLLSSTDTHSKDDDEPPSKQRKVDEVWSNITYQNSAGENPTSENVPTLGKECSSEKLDDEDVNISSHPCFDLSKLSVDPSCELCKKKTLEPKEKHLIMFLHALKYKGLDWAFETSLPNWAEEDWSKEDDYSIDTFQQS
ncbi:pseudouridylate synthase RPUSD2-like isoform X1 [Biomphalaria glabrata]|uniref:Pseudouridylate synthase RPUSD2-like isoform X1 n=2 Tax=Biomphalaria glabrata TaxID=6526 RepID=A0A9W3AXB8_BIOGL|nr:pseudouridylate synthase RPUSD2-like isoform X1 [Biomphalaria glabrata]XP_055891869.1 pseudouridylate synthase RPUSD2-like isoform X1 [Biomphalaria glabrata]XP_055891870.1 pseudouridylate synthase RPUSD2-like isoform X1 [Biomphalaria glabrata]